MKRLLLSLFAFFLLTLSQYAQSQYKNDIYGFSAIPLSDWKIYAEIKDDTKNKMAVIDWGMPEIYSDLEQSKIENAVSITALASEKINSIESLIKTDFERIKPLRISYDSVENEQNPTFIVNTIQNKLKYKSKSVYFYKNKIGYIVDFTATPGTYDKNVGKFNEFLKTVSFFAPIKTDTVKFANNLNFKFNGVYYGKTIIRASDGKNKALYIYLRFFEDGYILSKSDNIGVPNEISETLKSESNYEKKGKYDKKGSEFRFKLANSDTINASSGDFYYGKLTDENKIFLQITFNGENTQSSWFDFFEFK